MTYNLSILLEDEKWYQSDIIFVILKSEYMTISGNYNNSSSIQKKSESKFHRNLKISMYYQVVLSFLFIDIWIITEIYE